MTELPASISARIRNAKILIEQGRDADAVGVLRMALALAPALGEPRLLMAQALAAINRADEAEPHLRIALEDPTTAGDANGMLGYWFQARGSFCRGEVLLREGDRVKTTASCQLLRMDTEPPRDARGPVDR